MVTQVCGKCRGGRSRARVVGADMAMDLKRGLGFMALGRCKRFFIRCVTVSLMGRLSNGSFSSKTAVWRLQKLNRRLDRDPKVVLHVRWNSQKALGRIVFPGGDYRQRA